MGLVVAIFAVLGALPALVGAGPLPFFSPATWHAESPQRRYLTAVGSSGPVVVEYGGTSGCYAELAQSFAFNGQSRAWLTPPSGQELPGLATASTLPHLRGTDLFLLPGGIEPSGDGRADDFVLDIRSDEWRKTTADCDPCPTPCVSMAQARRRVRRGGAACAAAVT